MKYVIHKRSRPPGDVSYSGPTWDQAGLRASYRDVYDSYDEALELAKKLGEFNPVGFDVSQLSIFQASDEDEGPFEWPLRWDYSKPSRALVACSGEHCVLLETVGGDLDYWFNNCGNGPSAYSFTELADDGLSVWEGCLKGSGEDADFEGSFRDLTEDEWENLKAGKSLWDLRDWLLPKGEDDDRV